MKNFSAIINSGIPKEIKNLNLVHDRAEKLAAEIIYGNYTEKIIGRRQKTGTIKQGQKALYRYTDKLGVGYGYKQLFICTRF